MVKFIGTGTTSELELLNKIIHAYDNRWNNESSTNKWRQYVNNIKDGRYFYYITYSGTESLRGYFIPNNGTIGITIEEEAIEILTNGLTSTGSPA
mgnify:CR=1 FL=1